jgi:hypothetical protein
LLECEFIERERRERESVMTNFVACAVRLVNGFQILNGTVLGSILAGSVTMWNDVAIQELNPGIRDKLPAANIFVGYSNDTTKVLTFTEVFKLTMESFSTEFKEAFALANRTFAALPPALAGNSVRVGTSSSSRITWLQVL